MRGSVPASRTWCWSPGSTAGAAGGRRGSWGGTLGVDGEGAPADVPWVDAPGADAEVFRGVLASAGGAAAVGVDCPIGLPRDDWRPVALQAKRRVGAAAPP